MSFREIIIGIRAVNRASNEFSRVKADAESLTARVKSMGAALSGIGAIGTAVGALANQFGVLNDQQSRAFSSAMMLVSVLGMMMRTETGLAIAHKVYAAAFAVDFLYEAYSSEQFAASQPNILAKIDSLAE